MVSLSLSQSSLHLSGDGLLTYSHVDGPSISVELVPFLHELEIPYPYAEAKLEPLRVPLLGGESKGLPAFWTRRCEREGDTLKVFLTIGDWSFRQTISYTGRDDGVTLCTEMLVKPGLPLPDTVEVFGSKLEGWEQSRALVHMGQMGRNQIVPLAQCKPGRFARALFTLQNDGGAVLLHSKAGDRHPLVWARGESGWHGFVRLAPVMDEGWQQIGEVSILFGKSAQRLLEEYAERTRLPTPLRPAPRCWNSWDYYKSNISHEKIAECTRALAEDPVTRENIDTIVLDMGWEVRHGEWVADPNFPKGMKAMADEIRSHGFEAGLWFAPIIIDPECNEFQDDYNYVGKNRFGLPDRTYECCGLFGYILDVTRPAGADYLRNLFREYREMGYTYFKLDFLRYLTYVHRFADGRKTPTEVMQRALELIREGAGEDAYILGCNLPFEVGPGYCDACRTTSDVSVFWDSIRRNAEAATAVSFYHGRWWMNDLDFVVVRGRDTLAADLPVYRTWWFSRDDEYRSSPALREHAQNRLARDQTLTLEEARTHLSLELISGGAQVLADPYQWLTEPGRDLLRKMLLSEIAPGFPLDLFHFDGPAARWLQPLRDRTRMALFNWSDHPQRIEIPWNEIPGDPSALTDFWSGDLITRDTGDLLVPPRQCRVLEG